MTSAVPPPRLLLRCIDTAALTDNDVQRDTAVLDAEETARLQRFKFKEDRRDYAAAHALLRRMLTVTAPAIPPGKWAFQRSESGKPCVHAPPTGGRPVHFSLSHTRGFVACVVSRDGEVGVDVECDALAADFDRQLMSSVCSTAEQAQVEATAPAARAALFLDVWALKEAYVKALGLGIAVGLNDVSFDLRVPSSISASFQGKSADTWWMALLKPSAQCRIAVALAATPVMIPMLDAALVGSDGSEVSIPTVRSTAPHRLASTPVE